MSDKMTDEQLYEFKRQAEEALPFDNDEALDAVFQGDNPEYARRIKANEVLVVQAKKLVPGLIDELIELRKGS